MTPPSPFDGYVLIEWRLILNGVSEVEIGATEAQHNKEHAAVVLKMKSY